MLLDAVNKEQTKSPEQQLASALSLVSESDSVGGGAKSLPWGRLH